MYCNHLRVNVVLKYVCVCVCVCVTLTAPRAPATLLREGVYGTLRMGSYEPIKKLMGATDRRNTPLWTKICAGSISGESRDPMHAHVTFKFMFRRR